MLPDPLGDVGYELPDYLKEKVPGWVEQVVIALLVLRLSGVVGFGSSHSLTPDEVRQIAHVVVRDLELATFVPKAVECTTVEEEPLVS